MELQPLQWEILKISVHKLYSRREEDSSANIGDSRLIDMVAADTEAIELFKKRISDAFSLSSRFFSAIIENTGENSFYTVANSIISTREIDNNDFLRYSIMIAERLANIQTRKGLRDTIIIVSLIKQEDYKGVIVIKAELHEVLSANESSLTLIDKVFLSPEKKLYKIGFIIQDNNPEAYPPNNEYSAYIFDHQFETQTKLPAKYFYKEFLGFDLESNAKNKTKEFYNSVEHFVKERVVDPQVKLNILSDLKSYLRSNRQLISAEEFMELHIPREYHQHFRADVISVFIDNFVKDTDLIKGKLKSHKVVFGENKVILKSDSHENFELKEIDENNIENLQSDFSNKITDRRYKAIIYVKYRPEIYD